MIDHFIFHFSCLEIHTWIGCRIVTKNSFCYYVLKSNLVFQVYPSCMKHLTGDTEPLLELQSDLSQQLQLSIKVS